MPLTAAFVTGEATLTVLPLRYVLQSRKSHQTTRRTLGQTRYPAARLNVHHTVYGGCTGGAHRASSRKFPLFPFIPLRVNTLQINESPPMPRYEYKVVPAPKKGLKGKGVRGAEAKFSFAIEELMNTMAGFGWEYQRAETLPSLERTGLTGTTTEWRNVLVFRRLRDADAAEFQPELLPAPSAELEGKGEPSELPFEKEQTDNAPLSDNGVEDTQADTNIGASLSILARARSMTAKLSEEEPKKDPKSDS